MIYNIMLNSRQGRVINGTAHIQYELNLNNFISRNVDKMKLKCYLITDLVAGELSYTGNISINFANTSLMEVRGNNVSRSQKLAFVYSKEHKANYSMYLCNSNQSFIVDNPIHTRVFEVQFLGLDNTLFTDLPNYALCLEFETCE